MRRMLGKVAEVLEERSGRLKLGQNCQLSSAVKALIQTFRAFRLGQPDFTSLLFQ